jgi:hypothetical protein
MDHLGTVLPDDLDAANLGNAKVQETVAECQIEKILPKPLEGGDNTSLVLGRRPLLVEGHHSGLPPRALNLTRIERNRADNARLLPAAVRASGIAARSS